MSMDTIDFTAATALVRDLVLSIDGDQPLDVPSPCAGLSVGDVLDHLGRLSFAFTAAAIKTPLEGEAGPSFDGSRLELGWQQRIADALDGLAAAWGDPAAYAGTTQAGPVEMPAPAAASVALNEVVVHGWDIAHALGRPYELDHGSIAICLEFVRGFTPPPGGAADDGGLFGPSVAVPHDAPLLDQLLGATGRDPGRRA